jgi:XRE family aerobic/anaerobic benzoate catabolism transcriptional regulator
VRALRDRSGTTRKSLALATGVSERHLANLEYGEGNVSVLVLVQVATALNCSPAELIGDFTTCSPEWLMIRSLLENRDEQTLHQVRLAIGEILGNALADNGAGSRIALTGLRGAGKSTLGKMLATDLGFPFVELSREIEGLAGCSIAEIQDLYGSEAYRRYERRALEETVRLRPEAVIGQLHHDLVAGQARRPYATGYRTGRFPSDGRLSRGNAGFEKHPGIARKFLRQSPASAGYQQQVAGTHVYRPA